MKNQKEDRNPPSAALVDVISEIAEMRRTYAAVVRSSGVSEPRSIVVSSAVMSEGKTLTACGMAKAVAQQGDKRVLLVDLNWYRPAVHFVFGLKQTFSMDSLRDGAVIAGLTQETNTDRLDVLVAPLYEKNSVMAGQQLNLLAKRIIQEARRDYDISIIDSSAMYPTNRYMVDPGVFSNEADGVLLVVRTNKTPRKYAKRALMALETSGANVLGVVVNRCERIGE